MAARERHRRSHRNRHLALLMVVLPKGPNCSISRDGVPQKSTFLGNRNPQATPEPSC